MDNFTFTGLKSLYYFPIEIEAIFNSFYKFSFLVQTSMTQQKKTEMKTTQSNYIDQFCLVPKNNCQQTNGAKC